MKIISSIFIVVGAILVFMFNDEQPWHMYIKILGFVMLMFGLYKSTVLWVKDNPREDADNGE